MNKELAEIGLIAKRWRLVIDDLPYEINIDEIDDVWLGSALARIEELSHKAGGT